MPTVLASRRLVFSPFVATDLDLLMELHSDPEIMRYLSDDGQPWSREVIVEKLADFIAEHAARGHSKWKVCLHNGTFIGRAGFALWPPTGELELGFIIRRHLWGQGYATECAGALLDWVFDHTGVDHVIGFAREVNAASRRVLEKAGMNFVDTRLVGGIPTAFYRFESPQRNEKQKYRASGSAGQMRKA
jgi:[ribosomal protein S5]-alanine N-acetyltransferase